MKLVAGASEQLAPWNISGKCGRGAVEASEMRRYIIIYVVIFWFSRFLTPRRTSFDVAIVDTHVYYSHN